MRDRVQIRGEGGGVWTFDLPLPDAIAARVASGALTILGDPPGADVPGAGPVVSEPPSEPGDGPVDPPRSELVSGPVASVLAWVGSDPDRAAQAAEVEKARGDRARSTLLTRLAEIGGAG